MANIGDTIQDGSVVWTVGRKITNAPNIIADCDSVMEGSIKQFDSTTSNIPAVGAEGNLVTVGLASSKAQIAVTSDNKVYYRSYASSAWGAWQRLTAASEIVDSMSIGSSGYVKFGSLLGGFTIQWGLASMTASPTQFNYPISFATQGIPVGLTVDKNVNVWRTAQSPNGFSLSSSNASTSNYNWIQWIAIGY